MCRNISVSKAFSHIRIRDFPDLRKVIVLHPLTAVYGPFLTTWEALLWTVIYVEESKILLNLEDEDNSQRLIANKNHEYYVCFHAN